MIAFLRAAPRATNGLPARPKVGIAVPIRMDLTASQVDEWFPRS